MNLTKIASLATAAVLALSLATAMPTFAAPQKAKTVKVTFNANGGKSTTSKKFTVGKKLSKLPTVTRAGYTFAGWYTAKSGGKKVTKTTKVTKKATFFARWETSSSSGSTTTITVVRPSPTPIVRPTPIPQYTTPTPRPTPIVPTTPIPIQPTKAPFVVSTPIPMIRF